jgi:hypothetical protein
MDAFERLAAGIIINPGNDPLITPLGAARSGTRRRIAGGAEQIREGARRRKGNDVAIQGKNMTAHEEGDGKGAADAQAFDAVMTAAGRAIRESHAPARLGGNEGEEDRRIVEFNAQEQGGKEAAGIGNPQRQQRRDAGIDFIRGIEFQLIAFDVAFAGDAGTRHKGQQGGNDEIKEVVAGIDRGKTEDEGHTDIDPAGAGQLQRGTGRA